MAYNAGKKILHRCVSGKRFKLQRFGKKEILTQTKSPIQATPHPHPLQKSNGRPPKGYHTIETLDYCNID